MSRIHETQVKGFILFCVLLKSPLDRNIEITTDYERQYNKETVEICSLLKRLLL